MGNLGTLICVTLIGIALLLGGTFLLSPWLEVSRWDAFGLLFIGWVMSSVYSDLFRATMET